MAKSLLRFTKSKTIRHVVPIAAAVCLFCLAAQAGEITVDGHTFEAPPPHYDYEPARPYKVRVDSQLVDIFCGKPDGREILGCVLDDGKAPIVFIREGLSPDLEREVRRHELAHINGWEH